MVLIHPLADDMVGLDPRPVVRAQTLCPCDPSSWEAEPTEIVLMGFSRTPRAFYACLRDCEELQGCRLAGDVDATVLVFVHSWMRSEVEEVLKGGLEFEQLHVVVVPELEETVMRATRTLPSRAQVRLKRRGVVSLRVGNSHCHAGTRVD